MLVINGEAIYTFAYVCCTLEFTHSMQHAEGWSFEVRFVFLPSKLANANTKYMHGRNVGKENVEWFV